MKKIFTAREPLSHIFLFCYFLLIGTSTFSQWVSRMNGLRPRSEVTSIVYNGKVYAFFGFSDSLLTVVERSVEVYDPVTNTWTQLASVPVGKAVTHAATAVIDDKVWHIGGRVGKHPGPLTSEIWIYNIGSNTWSPGPKLIDPATGQQILWAAGGAAFLGRTLHVFGGMIINACNDATTGSGDQQKYHLTLNVDEWLAAPTQPAPWKNVLAPMPQKRNHFSTVVLGGKIYAIGGQYGHDCKGGQDIQYSHVYNSATNTWSSLPSLPTTRSHAEASSFAIDGKIYVVGGQINNASNTNKITIFDPAANYGVGAWTDEMAYTLPKVYETLSAKVVGSTFIISHGGQPRYNNPTKVTYTRVVSRTPVYKYGFLPACTNVQAVPGKSVITKTLLFTIDGSKTYTTSSSATWLKVTKNATGTAIQNGVDVQITINTTGLAPGTYQGVITVTGTGSGPSYTAAQYCVKLNVISPNTLEAEKALLNNVVVASNHPGFTGTGFGDYINSTGDFIEWTINKPSAGSTLLKFRYANGSAYNRPLKVEVNGIVIAASLAFPPTGAWSTWSYVSVTANLIAGINKVRLTSIGSSGANIDHLAWANAAAASASIASVLPQDMVSTDFSAFLAPNPASGIVKLSLSGYSDEQVEISIAYASGGVYKTFPARYINNGQFNFSVSDWPAGLYIVLVRQGKERASVKLIVGSLK